MAGKGSYLSPCPGSSTHGPSSSPSEVRTCFALWGGFFLLGTVSRGPPETHVSGEVDGSWGGGRQVEGHSVRTEGRGWCKPLKPLRSSRR